MQLLLAVWAGDPDRDNKFHVIVRLHFSSMYCLVILEHLDG